MTVEISVSKLNEMFEELNSIKGVLSGCMDRISSLEDMISYKLYKGEFLKNKRYDFDDMNEMKENLKDNEFEVIKNILQTHKRYRNDEYFCDCCRKQRYYVYFNYGKYLIEVTYCISLDEKNFGHIVIELNDKK